MSAPKLELGLQLHLPSYGHIPLRQLVRMAQVAHAGGMQQLWVTDNLQSRNAFVVLASTHAEPGAIRKTGLHVAGVGSGARAAAGG